MSEIKTLFNNTPVKAVFEIPEVTVPSHARVVIVGGGIAGASIAYHFAKAGWENVYLLEQSKLSSGTTWHSAGQVGQLRSSSAQTRVNKESALLYARLKKETGYDAGWLNCGGLQLASSKERMHQLERMASMADVFGVEAKIISPQECLKYWPMLNTDDLVGGVYLPGDGRVLPGECTISLASGAMQGGVKVIEGIEVQELTYRETSAGIKRINGVKTNKGEINAEWVVMAGNMWMRQLGLKAGIDIPVYPCEHHYVITKPIEGVTRNAPCTRDPNAGLYFRALDDGGLKLGAFKKRSKPWQIGDKVPSKFAFDLLEPDWPDFKEPFADHMHRLKGITRDSVVKFVNGPEAFTPDNNFIMGQPPLTEGLFVSGGWNSAGIACAGGAGKYTVEWIENGGMTMDLNSVDIRRFIPFQNGRKYLQERVSEVLGLHYQMAWPGRQMETSRGVRSSELYEKHKANNACFGETAGWERALYFAPKGIEPKTKYSFVRQNWHDWVIDEVKTCRNNVAILDQSTFAKYIFKGPDALNILQELCGANIDVVVNRTVYTGMFNERGTFESDLTVLRQSKDTFYIVTGTGQQLKDFDWIAKHIGDRQAEIKDVTEAFNVVSVMGPNAEKVLYNLNPEVFPVQPAKYGSVRNFNIEDQQVQALRVSYVGEMGWELHVPVAATCALYDAIIQSGEVFGIRPIGNHAVSAMRIEKGFRAIGHELSPDETPLEAGLGFAIHWEKDFIGKAALLKQKEEGLKKRLVCFLLDNQEITLWGTEPILWNGKIVGYTTSASYGPTAGASVAMGYIRNPNGGGVTKADLDENTFQITKNNINYTAKASFKSFV
ncbi:GcvT family protein [Snuella sedimenti]|uniref:FAD-dependent oxidoreductase n=1 Tax=Snuella sedimenti TaxID=2798802 RepID=A0A8J7IIH9_9FLAO|nr:FAD-dependent oxidoreductase [Snuella sedimenti]MBJ6368941.1 FAD-dependent oxidoreductase [Snuella sedimenti]